MFYLIALICSFIWLDHPLLSYESSHLSIKLITVFGRTYLHIVIWLTVMIVSLVRKNEKWFERCFTLLSNLALGIVIAYLMKVTIGRVRPHAYEEISFIPFSLKTLHHSSPSSHALCAFIVAQTLPYKKWLFPAATLVALSRVLLAKHFLSDVILGAWVAQLICHYGYSFKPMANLRELIKRGIKKAGGLTTGLKES